MKEGVNERIVELLTQRKMTQKQLAEKANITEAAVSHYIKGDRMPRAAVIERIADALGTKVDFLLNGEEQSDDEKELMFRLVARNAANLSYDEKKALMDYLFKPED